VEENVTSFFRNTFLRIADCELRITDSGEKFNLRIRNPYFRYMVKRADKLTSVNFAVLFHGQLVVRIGFFPEDDVNNRSAEIGYWIGEQFFWGKGIATESIGSLLH
jgi:RimJ/RimL family protein N-acetyltransferase